jgi:hypothetical protein
MTRTSDMCKPGANYLFIMTETRVNSLPWNCDHKVNEILYDYTVIIKELSVKHLSVV